MITDKPNEMHKDIFNFTLRRKMVPEEIHEKIQYHFNVPNRKYKMPLTSSQEIGWTNPVGLNSNFRSFSKNNCDVTKYADEYFALKGRSPYANKDPISKENKK